VKNNELHTMTAIVDGKITLDNTEIIRRGGLYIDQGVVVTAMPPRARQSTRSL